MTKAAAILSQSPTKPNGPPIWDGRWTMVHIFGVDRGPGLHQATAENEKSI
jgi:hypothetical protein